MSRKGIAVSVSAIVMMGSLNPAWSAPNATTPANAGARTESPLPAGSAAGIKQAQANTGGILLGAMVTGGIFAAMLLLIDSDDTGPATSSTTGTSP